MPSVVRKAICHMNVHMAYRLINEPLLFDDEYAIGIDGNRRASTVGQ